MLRRMHEPFDDDECRSDDITEDNEKRGYTEDALCDFCGTPLHGTAFQCVKCDLLTCGSCICDDGSCPACVRLGKADLPER
jgi:hypothetical protein